MDDFSSPGMVNEFGLKPAPVNFIQPGKRPQSSSAPVIITDGKGDVDIVTGASGGTVITTAVAQVRIIDRGLPRLWGGGIIRYSSPPNLKFWGHASPSLQGSTHLPTCFGRGVSHTPYAWVVCLW